MSYFEERLTINKKRRRDQRSFEDVQVDTQISASKRTCSASTSPQTDHPCLLEDICTVNDELVGDAVHSLVQEELISEMMKNLEKVIAATGEESSFSQKGQSEIDNFEALEAASPLGRPELLRLLSEEGQKHGGGDSSESEVDIRYLFEASDDELGIPPSPNSGEEKLFSFTDDVSWLDASCTDLTDIGNISIL